MTSIAITFLLGSIIFCFQAYGQHRNFLRTINQTKYHDPYDPKVQPNLFVGSIQVGSHAAYTTDTIKNLHTSYYFNRSTQLYLDIPELKGEYLSLGGEHLLTGALGDKNWLGAAFLPENSDFRVYFRGVNYRKSTAKIHYKLGVTIFEEALGYQLAAGYHTHAFRSSRNSYLDFRGDFRYYDHKNFSISNLSLIAIVGHGWADFVDVAGLELHGGIGFEYATVSYNYDTPILDDGSSHNDVDLRIEVRALYKSLL